MMDTFFTAQTGTAATARQDDSAQTGMQVRKRNGALEPVDELVAPEGTRALVTLLVESDDDFWREASASSLEKIWGNEEDDVYAKLL